MLGANHAIVDAVNLAFELGNYYQGAKTLDEAFFAYYTEMMPRGRKAVEESHNSAIMVHCYPELLERSYRATDRR